MSDDKSKKRRELTLQTIALVEAIAGPYMPPIGNLDDLKFEFDEQVNDCEMQMYFYMMTGEEKYYQAYIELYNKLDDERKACMDRKRDYVLNTHEAEEEKGNQKTIERKDDIYE